MEATVLNPVQLQLLQMFSQIKTNEGMKDLQNVLTEYYAKKVSRHADELWDKLGLNQQKLNDLCSIHERLPYK